MFKLLKRQRKSLEYSTFLAFSCHPTHCKANMTFTLARRFWNLIKNNNKKQKTLKEREKVLVSQEYSVFSISFAELRAPKARI